MYIASDLSDMELVDALRTAETIGSDFELAELMVAMQRRFDIEGDVREIFEDVAESISSDFEYRRVMSGLRRQSRKRRLIEKATKENCVFVEQLSRQFGQPQVGAAGDVYNVSDDCPLARNLDEIADPA